MKSLERSVKPLVVAHESAEAGGPGEAVIYITMPMQTAAMLRARPIRFLVFGCDRMLQLAGVDDRQA